MQAEQAIGIFDSGIGGLTAAHEISTLLPNEQIIYFGDTANMPYGDKSPEDIIECSRKITEFLISQNVKLIIIACNSASANAASYLRKHYHEQVEIRGVIRPMIDEVIRKKYKNIGIIGTKATIKSNIYNNIFEELNYELDIHSLATPKLAPMIEEKIEGSDSKLIIEEYLSHAPFKKIEALLLACTHYPIIRNEIKEYFNDNLNILDNAYFIAQDVKAFLGSQDMLSMVKEVEDKFFASKLSQAFQENAERFYKKDIIIKEVNL